MTKLAKWHVEEIMESFVLGGFPASDSERFLAGSSILTSMIDTVEVDELNKAFIFHTMSGSEYLCSFRDIRISVRFAEFSKDNLERMNISSDIIEEAIKLANEKESSLVTKLESEFNNCIITVKFSGTVLREICCRSCNTPLKCSLIRFDFTHKYSK